MTLVKDFLLLSFKSYKRLIVYCGIFLKADPHMLLRVCPGLIKALRAVGLYKPFRKLDLLTLLRTDRRNR